MELDWLNKDKNIKNIKWVVLNEPFPPVPQLTQLFLISAIL